MPAGDGLAGRFISSCFGTNGSPPLSSREINSETELVNRPGTHTHTHTQFDEIEAGETRAKDELRPSGLRFVGQGGRRWAVWPVR